MGENPDLASAVRAVEGKAEPNCLKCVWATNLGEREGRSALWVYCPFGGNRCLFDLKEET